MEYRVVVVGAGAVGKSALTVRFVHGTFVQKYDPTIEDGYRKQIEIDGRACVLDIMDTAGQEEYSALRDTYMKTGDTSFDTTIKLRPSILSIKDTTDIPTVLVGNKCDLESDRTVSTEEGQKIAEKWGAGFIEASAKTSKNVNEIFSELVRLIDRWRDRHPEVKAGPKKAAKTNKSGGGSFCVLL